MKKSNLTLLTLTLLGANAPLITLHAQDSATQEGYAPAAEEAPRTYQENYLAYVANIDKELQAIEDADQFPASIKNEFGKDEFGHWKNTLLQLKDARISDKLLNELIGIARGEDGTQVAGAARVIAFAAGLGKLSDSHVEKVFSLCHSENYAARQGASWALFQHFMHKQPTREQFNALTELACSKDVKSEGADATLHALAMDRRLSAEHFPILMRVVEHGDNDSWRTSLGIVEMAKQNLLTRAQVPALLSIAETKNSCAQNMGTAVIYYSHHNKLHKEDIAGIVYVAKSEGRGAQMMLHALTHAVLEGNHIALEGLIRIAEHDDSHVARPALFMLKKLIESAPDRVNDKYLGNIKVAIDKHKNSSPVFFQITPSSAMKV